MEIKTFRLLPSNLTSPNLKPGSGRPQMKLVCEPIQDDG